MTKWWMIRAVGKDLISIWLKYNIVSINWADLGDLSYYNTKEELLRETNRIYGKGNSKPKSVLMYQIWKFSHEIAIGDRIISYMKEDNKYIIGTVTDNYYYDDSDDNTYHPNRIGVEWVELTIDRSQLSSRAKTSLGSVLTVFRVDKWREEFEQLIDNSLKDKSEG